MSISLVNHLLAYPTFISDMAILLTNFYEALKVAGEPHAHKFSPKKFTQTQLAALLVFRRYLTTFGYRDLVLILQRSPECRAALDLKRVPHYSTLAQAESRNSVQELIRRSGLDRSAPAKRRRRRPAGGSVDKQ